MKTRTASIKTSNLGIIAIQEYCAKTNLIFQGEPREDYGVDCYIEVELETGPSNFLIGVQCRSGPSYRHDCADGSFVIYVSTDDVAYWLAANIPVLFVYYDANERLLYWHHVQAAAEFFGSVNEIKHLSFNSMDSVQNKPLGEYARRLVYVTPTVTDRMAIFSAAMNCVVDGQLFPIRPSTYPVRTELVEKELLSYSTVIGYSLDDRWILIQELVDCGGIAPEIMGLGPVPATQNVLAQAGLSIEEIDVFELNEPFAVQVLTWCDGVGVAPDDPRLNPYGGAIACGHPLAATGARLAAQLAYGFRKRPEARYGLTALCIGMGMGAAVLWERADA